MSPVSRLLRASFRYQGHCRNERYCSAWKSMAPTPHHPLHLAGACKDATAHPQHGHHRTTSCTTCSVRSPGMCTPQRQAKCPDTTAPGPPSRVPFLPSTLHTSCRHSTRVGRLAGKGTSLVSGFYQELVQVHGLKWREINHLGFLGRLRTQRILCKF